jgi:hypothetical protein
MAAVSQGERLLAWAWVLGRKPGWEGRHFDRRKQTTVDTQKLNDPHGESDL